jgi:hypothetical protein
MKVVCIDDFTLMGVKVNELTVGKIYDAFESSLIGYYQVINDRGYKRIYSSEFFLSLEKFRELKLKELGI